MGILDRFRRPQPKQAKALSSGFLALLSGEGSGRERLNANSSYADMVRLAYAQNATARACIDIIAQSVGSVNWLYYRGSGTGGTKGLDAAAQELNELDERHPIVAMLEAPNSEQSKAEWLQQFVMHYLLAGNAFCYSAIDVTGTRPRRSQLWWLDPDAVRVLEREQAGDPRRYEYRPSEGKAQVFTSEQVSHIKTSGVMNDRGIPAARAAIEAINQNNLARRWNSDLLSNSGRPSAVGKWMGGYELTDEQMQDRAQQIAPFFRPENAGKFLFTQFTDIQQYGMTPEQMGYIEGMKESMREICRAFRVPSQLLGDNEASTYSNYQEARKSLYQDVVIPISETLMGAMQRWLRVWEPGLLIQPDVDNIEALSEDAKDRFERANVAGFLTINERRLLAGYEPLDGMQGDMVLVAAGLMPLDQLALASEYTGDVMPDSEPEQSSDAEEATDTNGAEGGAAAV